MAIIYEDLFERIGKFICIINNHLDLQHGLVIDNVDEILDQYDGEDRQVVATLLSDMVTAAGNVQSNVDICLTYINNNLANLQKELSSPSSSLDYILPLLKDDMEANSESVNANTITSPTVDDGASNVGDGELYVSTVNVDGIDNEGIISEVVKVKCTQDVYGGYDYPQFQISGYPKWDASVGWKDRGNGAAIIYAADANNLVSNGDFEDADSDDVPTTWTQVGDLIDVSTGYRGTNCLRITPDGATAAQYLYQELSLSQNVKYFVSFKAKKDGAFATGGSTLTVKIDDDGENATSPVGVFAADPSTLNTDWTTYYAFFSINEMDLSEPTVNVYIQLTSASGLGATDKIYIDDVIVCPAIMFGGVAYAIVPGATDFKLDDVFTVTTENDYAGVIQTFFTRFYGFQLPSDNTGSETIDDAVAQDCQLT